MTEPLPEQPTMTDLVRHRHHTGAFGRAVFRLDRPLWDRLRAQAPPVERPRVWEVGLAQLLDIPVVIDDTIPADTWRLVDHDDTVLYEGRETTDAGA